MRLVNHHREPGWVCHECAAAQQDSACDVFEIVLGDEPGYAGESVNLCRVHMELLRNALRNEQFAYLYPGAANP